MARQMRLFLIRHGETVDNIAQVWAGTTDSALTNHGFQQATRLGLHFRDLGVTFTHIFASPLQRASNTARLVRDPQAAAAIDQDSFRKAPNIIHDDALMEQDFGFLEGKKWCEGRDDHASTIESKESIAQRVDRFLDGHLFPLLADRADLGDHTVAVVSHGLLLSMLWKRLLLRLPPKSVAFAPELLATTRPSLEHLRGWSNTGYLELLMAREPAPESKLSGPTDSANAPTPASHSDTVAAKASMGYAEAPRVTINDTDIQASNITTGAQSAVPAGSSTPGRVAVGWTTTIQTVNGTDHLKNFKRTRGGVGSSRYDASQKSIDSFFKKRKLDDDG